MTVPRRWRAGENGPWFCFVFVGHYNRFFPVCQGIFQKGAGCLCSYIYVSASMVHRSQWHPFAAIRCHSLPTAPKKKRKKKTKISLYRGFAPVKGPSAPKRENALGFSQGKGLWGRQTSPLAPAKKDFLRRRYSAPLKCKLSVNNCVIVPLHSTIGGLPPVG